MSEAQKYLLKNNLDDIVLNVRQYPNNTIENARKWIYLSDILKQYHSESKQSKPNDTNKVLTRFKEL